MGNKQPYVTCAMSLKMACYSHDIALWLRNWEKLFQNVHGMSICMIHYTEATQACKKTQEGSGMQPGSNGSRLFNLLLPIQRIY